ncbi:hypothetical protein IQ243_15245 [Nostocales cyanobacterium LEGE 11386]|nr:hypothetical protein [Nostocales cyanobacterium LEGE 11386]
MKEARHIATGRIVSASEADYPEYYGIFQCPHCKVGLRLRKEYTRSDGTIVTAAFIHPPGETELEKQCPYRINWNFSATKSKISYPNSREQCFKLLKKNFLKYLKYYSEVSLTEYYSTNTTALEAIDIFMSLNQKIIAALQNGKYILELANSRKIEQLYKDKIYKEINSYSENSIHRKIAILSIESELSFIKQKSNSLIWGLEFLVNEASEDFIKQTLDYIFGKYIYKRKIKSIELENEIQNIIDFGETKKY